MRVCFKRFKSARLVCSVKKDKAVGVPLTAFFIFARAVSHVRKLAGGL